MDEDILTAVIANDEAEALLTVEEFDDALGGAEHHAGAHVARRTRTAKAAATRTTAEAAATTGTAAAKAAATAAAEAITAAAAIAATTAAAAKAIVAAAFELVEPALALVETTTTPGTTSASIKAHYSP